LAQTSAISTQSFAMQQTPRLPQLKRVEIQAVKPVERRNPEPKDFADEVENQDQKRAESSGGGSASVVSLSDYTATRFQQQGEAPPPPSRPTASAYSGASAGFIAHQFANRDDSEPPPERNFGPRQQEVGISAYEAVQSSRPVARTDVEYMNEDTPNPAFTQTVGAQLPALNFLA